MTVAVSSRRYMRIKIHLIDHRSQKEVGVIERHKFTSKTDRVYFKFKNSSYELEFPIDEHNYKVFLTTGDDYRLFNIKRKIHLLKRHHRRHLK